MYLISYSFSKTWTPFFTLRALRRAAMESHSLLWVLAAAGPAFLLLRKWSGFADAGNSDAGEDAVGSAAAKVRVEDIDSLRVVSVGTHREDKFVTLGECFSNFKVGKPFALLLLRHLA